MFDYIKHKFYRLPSYVRGLLLIVGFFAFAILVHIGVDATVDANLNE